MGDLSHRIRAAAAVLALPLLLGAASGCGGSDAASGGGSQGKGEHVAVNVYSSFPLQGPSRPQAEALNNGAKLALEQAGGKAGSYAVTFKPLDDSIAQSGTWDPSQTSSNARKAALDKHGAVYLGEYNSGATAISLPLTNDAGMPQITVSSSVGLTQGGPGTAPGEPDKYYPSGERTLVRVAATDNVQGKLLAALTKQDGCRNLALVDDREVFGKGLASVVASAAQNVGIKIVVQKGMDKQAANYRSLAAGLASAGTACFAFTGCTASNAVQLYKDVAASLPDAKLYGSDCVLTEDFYDPAKGGLPAKVADRVEITAQVLPPDQYGPKGQKVFADYSKTYGVKDPDTYAIYGYELMELALEGLSKASATAGSDIADIRKATVEALFGLRDHSGALGTYSVTSAGDLTLGNLAVYRIQDGAPKFQRKFTVRP
jgi:branched-chain amino acid transport system substrate-binding protein